MKIIHFQFGKEGGAERFFVQLVNALARRNIEQTIIIRHQRLWRDEIDKRINVIENNFRNLSPDRLLLPRTVRHLIEDQTPTALLGWATRGSRLMPSHSGPLKISRLGDYPTKLTYFKNTDILVCNTPGIARHVRDLGWNRDVEVISNFTSTDEIAPIDRAQLNTPLKAPVIMAMGRFVPRKQFALLTSAIAQIDGAYLWLAGDGEELFNILSLAEKLNVRERVRFLGWQKDIRPFLAASDIFVMPSSHEPLGNVILEAWAQNRPVIATRTEGPTWFMRHRMNGLLFDIGDLDGLVRAIRDLIGNPGLAQTLAAEGRRALHRQFSEDAIVEAYLKLFGTPRSERLLSPTGDKINQPSERCD